jgi:hypothetical protein
VSQRTKKSNEKLGISVNPKHWDFTKAEAKQQVPEQNEVA